VIYFADGQVYRGEIFQGKRQGRGENKWTKMPGQQVYVGSWYQDKRQGRGTHRWIASGYSVTGQWYQGHLHGRVYMQWQHGATYDGDVIMGQKHGRGVHTWQDGKVYSGHYSNGTEEGYGTLTEHKEGNVDFAPSYRGQFLNGKRHGYGIQVWANKTYDGEWVKNAVHGRGKLVWNDLDIHHDDGDSAQCKPSQKGRGCGYYTGEFRRGKFHGSGCYHHGRNNCTYVGDFHNGRKHGTGRENLVDGGRYSGGFSEGRRHGYGRMTWPDGSLYTGGWWNGRRSGRGIQLAADGTVFHCGSWHNDKPIYEATVYVARDDTDLRSLASSSSSSADIFFSHSNTAIATKITQCAGRNSSSESKETNQLRAAKTPRPDLSPDLSTMNFGGPRYTLFWEV